MSTTKPAPHEKHLMGRIENLTRQIDGLMDERLHSIAVGVASFESELFAYMDQQDRRFDALEQTLTRRLDHLEQTLTRHLDTLLQGVRP